MSRTPREASRSFGSDGSIALVYVWALWLAPAVVPHDKTYRLVVEARRRSESKSIVVELDSGAQRPSFPYHQCRNMLGLAVSARQLGNSNVDISMHCCSKFDPTQPCATAGVWRRASGAIKTPTRDRTHFFRGLGNAACKSRTKTPNFAHAGLSSAAHLQTNTAPMHSR